MNKLNQYFPLLMSMPLFSGITEKSDLDWLLRCIDGKVEEYKAGDIIFEKGESMYFAGAVVSGTLQIEGEKGCESIDFGQMIPAPYDSGTSIAAPGKVISKTDSKVLFMRWIRMVQVCNFGCEHHKRFVQNLDHQLSR